MKPRTVSATLRAYLSRGCSDLDAPQPSPAQQSGGGSSRALVRSGEIQRACAVSEFGVLPRRMAFRKLWMYDVGGDEYFRVAPKSVLISSRKAVRLWTRRASEFRNGFEIGEAAERFGIPTDNTS